MIRGVRVPRLHQLSEPGNGILFMKARHIGVQTIYTNQNVKGVQAVPPFNSAISGITTANDTDTRNAEEWREKGRGSANGE